MKPLSNLQPPCVQFEYQRHQFCYSLCTVTGENKNRVATKTENIFCTVTHERFKITKVLVKISISGNESEEVDFCLVKLYL